jgi:WD40 repeat protein
MRSVGNIGSVAFSPDGRRIAVAEAVASALVWDTSSGKQVLRIRPAYGVAVAAYSPDGGTLAVMDGRETVRFFDAASGEETRSFPGRKRAQFKHLAFSPDGGTLAAVYLDHAGDGEPWITLWDVKTGRERLKLETKQDHTTHLTFSHDGALIASAGWRRARVWDTRTGKERAFLPEEPDVEWGRNGVAFLPDGQTFVTGQSRDVRFWNMQTGEEERRITVKERERLKWTALSADGAVLATAGRDVQRRPLVQLWDAASGKEIRRIETGDGDIKRLVFSPDGKRLAFARGLEIGLLDVATGRKLLEFPGHRHPVTSVAFSREGDVVASAGRDGLRLWSPATSAPLALEKHGVDPKLAREGREELFGLCYWAPGSYQAAAAFDTTSIDKVTDVFVRGRAISPGKTMILAFGCHDSKGREDSVRLIDAATGREVHRLRKLPDTPDLIRFSADGRYLATVYASHLEGLAVWDLLADKRLRGFRKAGRGRYMDIAFLAFSLDGKRLVTMGSAGICIWNVQTGRRRFKLHAPVPRHPRGAGVRYGGEGVAFSPGGRYVASGGLGGTVDLWDVEKGKRVRSFGKHRGGVTCLAFSPDGKRLASGSNNSTVLVWDLVRPKLVDPPTSEVAPVRYPFMVGKEGEVF